MATGWIITLANSPKRALLGTFALMEREIQYVLGEMALARGMVPLLSRMRQETLTAAERAELFVHLRRVYVLGPYLMFALLPGSFLAIPLFALWRERRRQRAARTAAVRA